ncbi:hypothetical protein [Pseudochryseolinea flava]|uniref:Uncharacterized protein n=1 Tax=Pseudochryseolinea flava TaxID=2059302 RepID=A0A364Y0K6_9BACT|nr:hypothetical protein [Pseudochryseolinea flava]RAV99442.1 hypothetical protein DQQ10_19680 [Pseudochryseolinea flava]
MEFILLTIWKSIVIIAGLVFITIVVFRSSSRIVRFLKRRFSPKKRSASRKRNASNPASYSTAVIEKI